MKTVCCFLEEAGPVIAEAFGGVGAQWCLEVGPPDPSNSVAVHVPAKTGRISLLEEARLMKWTLAAV